VEAGIHLREESITLKELLQIVMACAVWGKEWAVPGDVNLGVVALVNSGVWLGASDHAPPPVSLVCQGSLSAQPVCSAYHREGEYIGRHHFEG
jgi:hypothetical protein